MGATHDSTGRLAGSKSVAQLKTPARAAGAPQGEAPGVNNEGLRGGKRRWFFW